MGEFPPRDQRGVPQPDISTKEVIIICLMLGLWAYSIYLTIRAWRKLLSDGSVEYTEGNQWWRILMEHIRSRRRNNENDTKVPNITTESNNLLCEKYRDQNTEIP